MNAAIEAKNEREKIVDRIDSKTELNNDNMVESSAMRVLKKAFLS